MRPEFRPTHLATYHDGDWPTVVDWPPIMEVMEDGDHAFTREEWESGRPVAAISKDKSRSCWSLNGGYTPVTMTPVRS